MSRGSFVTDFLWLVRLTLADGLRGVAAVLSTDYTSPLPPSAILDDTSAIQPERDIKARLRHRAGLLADHAQEHFNPLKKARNAFQEVSLRLTPDRLAYLIGSWMCSTLLWLPYAYLLIATHPHRSLKYANKFPGKEAIGVLFGLCGPFTIHDVVIGLLLAAIVVFWIATARGVTGREIVVEDGDHTEVYIDPTTPDPVFIAGVVGVVLFILVCLAVDAVSMGKRVIGLATFALGLARGLTYASAHAVNNKGMSHLSFIFGTIDWLVVLGLVFVTQNNALDFLKQFLLLAGVVAVLGVAYIALDYSITGRLARMQQQREAQNFTTTLRTLFICILTGFVLVGMLYPGWNVFINGIRSVITVSQVWVGFGIGAAPHWLQWQSRTRQRRSSSGSGDSSLGLHANSPPAQSSHAPRVVLHRSSAVEDE
eukprot:TRINITY_DN1661_c0_g1::TRINITY_DN1661_c0_g1_i1::g.17834::m.17834 TRINITY_DN1661_c0_g1::TRINITY_DN1661_c0_g1_i1::g.17834  ORF type:complete len:425 (+),score=63.71,Frag1/PF10277.4/7e+02,Frag1/PF10277.4/0.018 TRINITY_DN1661_c0_g1_i1:128-1402(+)